MRTLRSAVGSSLRKRWYDDEELESTFQSSWSTPKRWHLQNLIWSTTMSIKIILRAGRYFWLPNDALVESVEITDEPNIVGLFEVDGCRRWIADNLGFIYECDFVESIGSTSEISVGARTKWTIVNLRPVEVPSRKKPWIDRFRPQLAVLLGMLHQEFAKV
jgi:hypothetical protein